MHGPTNDKRRRRTQSFDAESQLWTGASWAGHAAEGFRHAPGSSGAYLDQMKSRQVGIFCAGVSMCPCSPVRGWMNVVCHCLITFFVGPVVDCRFGLDEIICRCERFAVRVRHEPASGRALITMGRIGGQFIRRAGQTLVSIGLFWH